MPQSKIKELTDRQLKEHEHALYIDGELQRVLEFLEDHRADDRLVRAVEFAISDNRHWINKDLITVGNA